MVTINSKSNLQDCENYLENLTSKKTLFSGKDSSTGADVSLFVKGGAYASYDTNKDGKISIAEAEKIAKAAEKCSPSSASDAQFKDAATKLLKWIAGSVDVSPTNKKVTVQKWGSDASKGNKYANDCLINIVKNNYPSVTDPVEINKLVDKIAKANNISNKSLIFTGAKIKLVDVAVAKKTTIKGKETSKKNTNDSTAADKKMSSLKKAATTAIDGLDESVECAAEKTKLKNILYLATEDQLNRIVSICNSDLKPQTASVVGGAAITVSTANDSALSKIAKEIMNNEQPSTKSTKATDTKFSSLMKSAGAEIDKLPNDSVSSEIKTQLKLNLYKSNSSQLIEIISTCKNKNTISVTEVGLFNSSGSTHEELDPATEAKLNNLINQIK